MSDESVAAPVPVPVLEARNLHYVYQHEHAPGAGKHLHAAMDGVSFALAAGERVALLGANGAGKSTLLLSLLGLLKRVDGEVLIAGELLRRKNARRLRAKLGLLFQDPDDQLFNPTVFDDVAFGPRNLGVDGDELQSRVRRALADAGVSELAERSPMRLSVGQKKRVALAGVLAMQPDVLALDEPDAALDPRGRRELIATLGALSPAMLVVTHDLAFASALCERALVMDQGKLVFDGEMRALMSDEAKLLQHGLA